METLQTILVTGILAVWFCLSIFFLVSSIMFVVDDRKREKREKAQITSDLEYHNKRMEALK